MGKALNFLLAYISVYMVNKKWATSRAGTGQAYQAWVGFLGINYESGPRFAIAD